jgi:hypothetical protein
MLEQTSGYVLADHARGHLIRNDLVSRRGRIFILRGFAFGGRITVKTLSLVIVRHARTDQSCGAHWPVCHGRFDSFESLVTRAGNSMVSNFLADDRFAHRMWIDTCIGFSAANFKRLLHSDCRRRTFSRDTPFEILQPDAKGLIEVTDAHADSARWIACSTARLKRCHSTTPFSTR